MTSVVFVGPTLPAADLDGVTMLPPARQGDIFRAVQRWQPTAIGLIDGVFLDVPAVWHREILWALDRGIHVLGAASMGALRAAELDRFGMRGIGLVYEAYRDGHWPGFTDPFEDDDEVAVVHAPPDLGAAPLSDAMVDLRATLRAAVAAGVIDEISCARLAALAKSWPFPARSVAALATAGGPGVAAWIARHAVHQKRIDAQQLLAELRTIDSAPFRPQFRFTEAMVWRRFVDSERTCSPALLRLREHEPGRWRALRREAAGRMALLASLPAADDAAARRIFDRFRMAHGLVRYEDIQAWLCHHDVDVAALARLMQEEARLDAVPDTAALEATMLDLLLLAETGSAAETA